MAEWVTAEEAALLFHRANAATAPAACASTEAYVLELSGGAADLEAKAQLSRRVVAEVAALVGERRAAELWDARADTPDLVRAVAPEVKDPEEARRISEAIRGP